MSQPKLVSVFQSYSDDDALLFVLSLDGSEDINQYYLFKQPKGAVYKVISYGPVSQGRSGDIVFHTSDSKGSFHTDYISTGWDPEEGRYVNISNPARWENGRVCETLDIADFRLNTEEFKIVESVSI